MDTAILLTGGTGTLGKRVLRRLRRAGREVRVLSRHRQPPRAGVEYVIGDLDTGEGIDAAVRGIATIVHCAGSAKRDEDKARNLVRAAAAAGVGHLVYISVVGSERIPVTGPLDRTLFGYFAAKRAAELVIADSGVPWTTLRATQFYDLILLVVRKLAKLPVMPAVTGFRFQPVDTDEVAAQLVELALGEPAGLVPDLAGPKVYPMADLIREYLRVTDQHRLILPLWMPGGAAQAVRAGGNLAPAHAGGRRTWEEFLALRRRA